MTVGIFTGKAQSLITVSGTIAEVAHRLGEQAEVLLGMTLFTKIARSYDKVIIFQPFYPTTVYAWISLYTSLRRINHHCLFYTTAEGSPLSSYVKEWTKNSVELIANSNYTASVLREVGLNIVKVVPHGLLLDEMNHIRNKFRLKLRQKEPNTVIFGMVTSAIERKGMDKLPIIAKKCMETVPQARFEVITTPDAPIELHTIPNVIVMDCYGKLERYELLSKMASWDFYLCLSHAEGFGLPMVEAQALGIPCIHANFPPLTEVLHPDNLKVKVTDIIDYHAEGYGAFWRLHMYDPEEMVERIREACELRQNIKSYTKLSQKLIHFSKRFDAMQTYKELLI